MDALIESPHGSWVVEYKTVSPERFAAIREEGPLVSHWAQLQLYMAVGSLVKGTLVVDQRESANRLIYHAEPDPVWAGWLRARIDQVKEHQTTRKLPPREVSTGCYSCDRWQRCFASEEARDHEVESHPVWEPYPEVPQRTLFAIAEEIVS